MAAWFDLIQRIETLEERGLVVATDYHGQGLPKWLQPALGDCDVFVLNVKNVPTDSTLCIVRLARLEQLLSPRDDGKSRELEQLLTELSQREVPAVVEDSASTEKLLALLSETQSGDSEKV